MKKCRLITAIDIGSSKVATIIAQVSEDLKINVVGASSIPSLGIKKGQIVDIEQASGSIVKSVESAERMAGCSVNKVLVTIGGAHISSQNSHGVVAVAEPDKEIVEEDIKRVIDAARAVSLPSTREIIHIIPRSYIVDSQDGIADPRGMSGVRLEVDTHIITASTTAVKNLTKCVGQLGSEIGGIVFSGAASTEAVLSETEKDLGVIMLDIGGGTTSLIVYSDGSPSFTTVFPIGAIHVTKDLAAGLRFSNLESAEKVKLALTKCFKKGRTEEPSEDKIVEDELDLAKLGVEEETRKVSKKTIVEGIIKPRLSEIFEMVAVEIQKNGLSGCTPAGVVLTGGGALTIGAPDICKRVMSLPVRIGFPSGINGLIEEIDGPAYSSAIGLLLRASRNSFSSTSVLFPRVEKIVNKISIKGIVGKMSDFVKSFLP